MGSLPRSRPEEFSENLAICGRLSADKVPCLYSVGLKDGLEQAKQLKDRGATFILVDVANGEMLQVKELAKEIKKKLKVSVVAGNIATRRGVESYTHYGIDVAKIGIGPGGLCTTRLIAGTGVPQLAALFDTSSVGVPIIADGGIVYPGDVAKAVAAGARMVMIGSLFAGTDETPGLVDANGLKTVRGQASLAYMKDNKVSHHKKTPEGISAKVRAKGKVAHVISQIEGGLRSAMSYTGARTIREYQEKAIFCIASHATQKESQPHIGQME
jgi:IMP dehydrogenase